MSNTRRQTLSAAGLFVLLTIAATFPIITAPASYAYFAHSDAQLNMWVMAWDAHALRHDPLNLFNANIFTPEPRTLAFSETLLGYLPIFGPILWLHGTPALAFNAVLLFSFAASGFCMYLLVHHLTGRWWPAIASGIVYAFVPYRFVHVPQIQLEAMEWMPLAFLCLHLFVERGEWKWAVGLGASVVMETLCCVYYGVFLAMALAVALMVLLLVERRARTVRTLGTIAITAIISVAVLAPLVGEYMRVHRTRGLERPLAEITEKSADGATYLASSAPLHQHVWASAYPRPRDYLFPGIAAFLLAGLAVAAAVIPSRRQEVGTRRQYRMVLLYAAVTIVGLIASFGPAGLAGIRVYTLLYDALPVFHGLRQVSRFGVVVLFGVCVLAGYGAAILERRLDSRRMFLGAAVAAILFLELFQAPLRADRPGGVPLVRVPPVPPVYAWLSAQPGTFAILELPLAHPGLLWQNAPYVYWSTVHWHGVVDGYSGFAPKDYDSLMRIFSHFPDELSRKALLIRHVRYVIIHRDQLKPWSPPLNFALIDRTPWLRQAARFPDVDVLEVEPDDRTLARSRHD